MHDAGESESGHVPELGGALREQRPPGDLHLCRCRAGVAESFQYSVVGPRSHMLDQPSVTRVAVFSDKAFRVTLNGHVFEVDKA